MRRTCSAVIVAAMCAACGSPLEISLQIQRANPDDNTVLQSLAITIANGEQIDGPLVINIDREAQVDLGTLTVDKTKPFTIDVWGCREPDRCGTGDVALRGCTEVPIDARNETRPVVPIVIRLKALADDTCPPI